MSMIKSLKDNSTKISTNDTDIKVVFKELAKRRKVQWNEFAFGKMNQSLQNESAIVVESYMNETNITDEALMNYSDYVRDRALNFYFYRGGFVKANNRTAEIIIPFYMRRIKE